MPRLSPGTLAVVALVALGAGLRMYGLDVQSLWHDELSTVHASQLPTLADVVRVGGAEDVHPPGHPLLVRAWTSLVGTGAPGMRASSAVAGILTLPLLAALGGRLGEGLGWRTAMVGALAWMPIHYSQELRPYAWVLLATTALLTLLVTPGRSAVREAAAIGLTAALAAWMHYFGLLAAALAIPAAALARQRRGEPWKPVVAGGLLALLVYLPWLAALTAQVERGKIWIPPVTLGRVADAFASLCQGWPVLALALWLLGMALARDRRPFGLAGAWVVALFVAAVAVSLAVLPVLTDRNLIVAFPGIAVLTAASARAIDGRVGEPVATGLLAMFLLVDLVGVRAYYTTPTKPDYRGLVAELARRARPGEPIGVGVWNRFYVDYYAPPDLVVTAHSVRKRDRAALFAQQPPVVHLAFPISERIVDRCTVQQPGYTQICEERVGWDLYRFERTAADATRTPRVE
ncbi:MAG: glycosyltransferase family 39 protein [Myxococcales bacterium]|nr:glycosyltransferase family 39 protein [Myxococcales bacterium]MCB9693658.1 glycosyltransferase family 39 protein [Alphaproteobacteria bacterium]